MTDSNPDPRQPLPNDGRDDGRSDGRSDGPDGRDGHDQPLDGAGPVEGRRPSAGAPASRPAGPVPAEIQLIVDALDDRRAKDILVLDLEDVSESLSFFVIATGESAPQMRAMQESVRMAMKEAGELPSGVEGPSERWVLIDYGPIVVHLMSPEAREFYDIEGLWADARPMDIAPSA